MLFGVRQLIYRDSYKIEYSKVHTVDVSPYTFIQTVKSILENVFNIPKDTQLLFYDGHLLQDNNNVAHYGVQSDSVLTLIDARTISI